MDLNNLNVDGIILNNVDINSTFQSVTLLSIISLEKSRLSLELSTEIVI